MALLLFVSVMSACQSQDETRITNESTRSTANATPSASPVARTSATTPAGDAPPVVSSHGGGATSTNAPTTAAGGTSEKADADTSALDAKIAKAEAKAKASGASAADKRAAAEAYFERGYFYYTAQNPKLYKFALGDFRRTLRYQPDNAEARQIIAQIEDIYKSMGRPIPTNGLEP
jgi:hypothetical protein